MSFAGLEITCASEVGELIMAELSLLPFNTFEETDSGIQAYCELAEYPARDVQEILDRYRAQYPIEYRVREIPRENWNTTWEANYPPVKVSEEIYVRAPFHESIGARYELIVQPNMSFGTGHHETTHLMLLQQVEMDHEGKTVYDFGTGTGILSIMAAKLGAESVIGTDIDPWCVQNSKENFELNNVSIELLEGTVQEVGLSPGADIILANINKNILIREMKDYVNLLSAKGILLLSGFYSKDIDDLVNHANQAGLNVVRERTREEWACLLFERST